jgi:hypothetical protein
VFIAGIQTDDLTLRCNGKVYEALIARCAEHFAEMARESKGRLKCYEATRAPVGIGKDEFFFSEAYRFRAKLKQDELVETCMLAKGWPKKRATLEEAKLLFKHSSSDMKR